MPSNAACARDATRATTRSRLRDEEQKKSKCGAFEPELPRFLCGTVLWRVLAGYFLPLGLSTCYNGRYRHTGSRWGPGYPERSHALLEEPWQSRYLGISVFPGEGGISKGDFGTRVPAGGQHPYVHVCVRGCVFCISSPSPCSLLHPSCADA
jgi:hypothetical protein